jgi:hypothetical protein
MESEIILGPPLAIGERGGAGGLLGLAAALTACSIALSLPKAKSQMRDWTAVGATAASLGPLAIVASGER